MNTSAIILAGGMSSRFGQDKGLLPLAGKPLISYVLQTLDCLVEEVVITVSSRTQAENYMKIMGPSISIEIDKLQKQTPLVGTLTGLEKVKGTYSLVLPCDTPLVSRKVIKLMFELSEGRTAVIPRWPNCHIEPLLAVYKTAPALEACKTALEGGSANVQAMVDKMQGVRYISTLVLQQLDPELNTFLNVNTSIGLRKAERLLRAFN